MLVLSRQKGQSIIIGDRQVKITVVEIRGDKVRIGVEADEGISIHREEVFNNLKAEQEGAEASTAEKLEAKPQVN